ncbi:MAG: tRNA epoxyqueuosine(34) reductase QueG [Desulfatiglans sp.]|nr:tRNA epoxyqueuosine(34) reductase QueG [Thermodesulfobacteriota bacterium]MEE4351316.1 tRNA epoxyqueuosine(34) reductase QueG [Desulfatiglans sp.]
MISSFVDEARQLGFLKVGFARAERPVFFDEFVSWLDEERQHEMHWLKNHLALREDPQQLLKGCKSVISLAYPYPARKPYTTDGFCAARYSEPGKADYHRRLRSLCQGLADLIVKDHPEARTRVCVDSAPLLERSFAYMSGIGFIGKNNMLIIPGYGSYFFLAEILTTISFPPSVSRPVEDQCQTCTRCINSCPSGALEKAYCFIPSKCLSYLTIEHRESPDRETGKKMGRCFFGCDICQEVCPFNETASSKDVSLPSTGQILKMGHKEFEKGLGKTAFARAGLEKLKSNIRVIR